MRNVLGTALLALQLWSPAPPAPPTVFVIAFDGSRSVPAVEFGEYADMICSTVLRQLRPSDTVVLLRMERPQDPPETIAFSSRLSRFEDEASQLYTKLRSLQQSTGQHGTDIGLALDHLRRRIDFDRTLNPSGAVRYVMVAPTDGVIDGRQTTAPAAKGTVDEIEWHLVFLGVKDGAAPELRRLAVQNGFDNERRTLVVPFALWRQVAPSIPGFIGRSPNTSLIRALSCAPPVGGQSRR